MQASKLIILFFAFFTLMLAVSIPAVWANEASSEEEAISDRRFRWEGSNDKLEESQEGGPGDNVKQYEIIESIEYLPSSEN